MSVRYPDSGILKTKNAGQKLSNTREEIHLRKTFKLTLEPLPDTSDSTGIRRLRAALKVLLRRYGLRCVWLAEAPQSDEQKPNRPESRPDGKTQQRAR